MARFFNTRLQFSAICGQQKLRAVLCPDFIEYNKTVSILTQHGYKLQAKKKNFPANSPGGKKKLKGLTKDSLIFLTFCICTNNNY